MPIFVFDLDGTLINSIEGIMESIDYSCDQNNLNQINRETLEENIGPPINQYLPKLLGISKKELIWEKFIKDFRDHHDHIGYKSYNLYPHAKDVLFDIVEKKNTIYIVTNKPYYITIKTLQYFNLLSIFEDIYALDQSQDKVEPWTNSLKRNKINYLDFISKRHPQQILYYIGDRESDLIATNKNKFNFIYASYGYGGKLNIKTEIFSIKSLLDIKSIYKIP